MNNTCKEVLSGLLDKSKVSSLRKAWKECRKCEGYCSINRSGTFESDWCDVCKARGIFNKPAKFAVGDKVQMVWDEESNKEIFCTKCGGKVRLYKETFETMRKCCNCGQIGLLMTFHKVLGVVEITEVFKVEMWKKNGSYYVMRDKKWINNDNLAKDEGFKSAILMFTYFNLGHDLSTPKTFWCYKWRWV